MLASRLTACGLVCAYHTSRRRSGTSSSSSSGSSSLRPIFLSVDLDGTLVGSPAALAAFNAYWQLHERPLGSVLCYNTARCITDYKRLREKCREQDGTPLLRPDILITGDGTEIRWRSPSSSSSSSSKFSEAFSLDQIWRRKIDDVWIGGSLGRDIKQLLAPHDMVLIKHMNDIGNSPPDGERRFSITVRTGQREAMLALLKQLRRPEDCYAEALKGYGDATEDSIVTTRPACAGKGNAALYAAATVGFEPQNCVSAGDTRGDSSMLLTPIPFISVGNAHEELRSDAKSRGPGEGGPHYQSEAHHAAGVLEGLLYFRAS